MRVLKWLLGGFLWVLLALLAGVLTAGCTSQQMLQYQPEQIQPDPPPQHLPSLWCEVAEKGLREKKCIEPKEARK